MKKQWNAPEVQSLNVSSTEMSPKTGGAIDASYIDSDGHYWNSYVES